MTMPSIARGSLLQEDQQGQDWPVDFGLLATVVALLCLGVVMVSSTSISIAEQQHQDPFYYLVRHLAYLAFGLFLVAIIVRIPIQLWEKAGPALIMLSMVMLLLVLIPGLGKTVNGSTRWLALVGFSLQPSEFVKLFTLVYLSGYLVRHHEAVRSTVGGFIRPILLMLVLVVLLLLEPDYGAAAVLLATAMGMMWLAGVRMLQFFVLISAVALVLVSLAVIAPYRVERLTTFLNPWADPFDSGFQLTQALIAFGRGEWFGVGLGSSVQKLFYLPEAHTDFLFAVMAEELGLLGVVLVIGLFAFLVFRILRIARRAEYRERVFAAYLSYAIGFWITLQAIINLGVNMGILPTKGLTLPFMSYGGTSLVVMLMAVALLIRVDFETRKDNRVLQRKGKLTW